MTIEQNETIKLVIEEAKKQEWIIGLILCGSLAKGNSRKDSDVDLLVVVTDDHFNKARKNKGFFWKPDQDTPCDVDGKMVNMDFLERSISEGNEAIWNTLRYSKLIYWEESGLQKIQSNFKNLQIRNKDENIKRYFSLMKSSRYSADDDLDNWYTLKKCMLDIILYASRLVLAHNEILFPCEKNMVKEIQSCKDKPPNFIKNMHTLLKDLSLENLAIFYDEVESYFADYIFDDLERKGFVLEHENFWYFDIFPFDEI